MSATYFLRTNPFELSINELRERNEWIETIPSKCQNCHQPMKDNTRPTHPDCEAYRLEHYKDLVEESTDIFDDPHRQCDETPCIECREDGSAIDRMIAAQRRG